MRLLCCCCFFFTALRGRLISVHRRVEAQQSPNKHGLEEKTIDFCECALIRLSLSLSSSLQLESSGFDRREERPGRLRLVRATHTFTPTFINAKQVMTLANGKHNTHTQTRLLTLH